MRVTVLSHDLSQNCLGRAHVLAKLVERFADVVIAGPSRDGTIWEPLRDDCTIPIEMWPTRRGSTADVMNHRPDAIYAVKARPGSLGLALRVRKSTGVPVVADCDDWELAFCYDNPRWWLRQSVDLRDPDNFWGTIRADRSVQTADAVTVASTWLQKRYGGTVVRHVRDPGNVSGLASDRMRIRQELGVSPSQPLLLFMGSARPHKGLGDVLAALDSLDRADLVFAVVGSGPSLAPRPWLRQLGMQPFSEVPGFLAAADVIVLAQQPTRVGRAQVPAKVFDAMAAGRPVISTAVSDMADIIRDAGVVVPPCNPASLAQAIDVLTTDPSRAANAGRIGRNRLIGEFSTEATLPRVKRIFDSVVSSAGSAGNRR